MTLNEVNDSVHGPWVGADRQTAACLFLAKKTETAATSPAEAIALGAMGRFRNPRKQEPTNGNRFQTMGI